ncbi:heavy metal-associated domain-containing protein [Gilvibacter sp.]|uniref:heavy-metal-associated domain-containing protein n=1 Tax=Gilvibacter sp. TaxID=2729997 RepID=UPI0025C16630|nr:heavy metal-associated domain-containing protein [Gilvibacter sp.]NQX77402.1 heavy-metal-associated domain-containing protein [Gilvibacter sp.]
MSTQIIHIQGMTCMGCVKNVKDSLEALPEVSSATVSLDDGTAILEAAQALPQMMLQQALGDKYTINPNSEVKPIKASKLKQLRPLLIIFAGLLVATALLNYQSFSLKEAMMDFMGLFFLVFGFFKLLDLKGFPEIFAMYDPLAKAFRPYGWAYPFIELTLGTLLLFQIGLVPVFVTTLVLLSITTVGILRSILDKREIRCACLGTWLNLPMTEATLIENAVMIIMAIYMLTQTVVL